MVKYVSRSIRLYAVLSTDDETSQRRQRHLHEYRK